MHARRLFSVAIALISLTAVSWAKADWDPEQELPPVTFIGNYSPAEVELGNQLREGMVGHLAYWKNLGLPNPVDFEGIYVLTLLDNEKVASILRSLNPSLPDAAEHLLQQWSAFDNSELAFFLRRLQGELQTKGRLRANLLFSQFLLRVRAEPIREILYDFKKIVFAEADADHHAHGVVTNEGSYLNQIEDGQMNLIELFFDYYTYLRYGWSVHNLHLAVQEDLTYKEAKQRGGGLNIIPETDNAFVGQFPKIDLSAILHPAVDQNPERKIQWNRLINLEALNEIAKDGVIPVSSRAVFLPRYSQGYDDTEISILHDRPVAYHEQGHQWQNTIQQVNRMVNEALADLLAVGYTNDPKIGVFFAEASGIIADRLERRGNLSDREKRIVAAFKGLAAQGHIRDMEEEYPLNKLPRFGYFPDDYTAGHPLRNFLWQAREKSGLDTEDFDKKVLEALVEFADLPMNINSKAQGRIALRQAILNLLGGPGSRLGEGVEKVGRTLQSILSIVGMRFIPRASHDYVTIEFIRTLFRKVATAYPQAQDIIKELAEKVVGRRAMVIETAQNKKEILFAHGPRAALSKWLWARRFSRLEALRSEYEEAKDRSAERVAKIQRQYDIILRSIQEFERTLHVGAIASPLISGTFGAVRGAATQLRVPKTVKERPAAPPRAAARSCESLF